MIDTATLNGPQSLVEAGVALTELLLDALSITDTEYKEGFDE